MAALPPGGAIPTAVPALATSPAPPAVPPSLAPQPGGPDAPGPRAALGYTLFRQAGAGYLLPAASVVGVLDADHVLALPSPVAGWAGTLAVRGGAIPVLDAAALLGHGDRARVVLVLRAASGPLGLAVERLDGLQPLGPEGLVNLDGAAGLVGGTVVDGEVWLALAPEHFAALRAAALGADTEGRPLPRPVVWTGAAEEDATRARESSDSALLSLAAVARHDSAAPAEADAPPRVGEPLLVLGERLADRPDHALALPLRVVRAVDHVGRLRPGPPGRPAVAGYRAWGRLPVPVVALDALGVAEPVPAASVDSDFAVLLALGTAADRRGVALLVRGVRGVQRFERTAPLPASAPAVLLAAGETSSTPVAVLGPAALAAALR